MATVGQACEPLADTPRAPSDDGADPSGGGDALVMGHDTKGPRRACDQNEHERHPHHRAADAVAVPDEVYGAGALALDAGVEEGHGVF